MMLRVQLSCKYSTLSLCNVGKWSMQQSVDLSPILFHSERWSQFFDTDNCYHEPAAMLRMRTGYLTFWTTTNRLAHTHTHTHTSSSNETRWNCALSNVGQLHETASPQPGGGFAGSSRLLHWPSVLLSGQVNCTAGVRRCFLTTALLV